MPVRGMSQRFFLKALAGEKPRLPFRPAGHQLVKKVQRDFFDKLTAKLQNMKLYYYFAILAAAAGD